MRRFCCCSPRRNGVSKLVLKIGEGNFEPEEVFNELIDLEKARSVATDAAHTEIMKVLYKKFCENPEQKSFPCHDFHTVLGRPNTETIER